MRPKAMATTHEFFREKGGNRLRKLFIKSPCDHLLVPIMFLSLIYSRVRGGPTFSFGLVLWHHLSLNINPVSSAIFL